MEADYNAWGHSLVVNPNASVQSSLGEEEGIVYADLDNETIVESRKGIPIETQRRFDVYPVVSAGKVRYEE
jgi:predicted amidohydrolase